MATLAIEPIRSDIPERRRKKKEGLALWMERVLEECDRSGIELSPDPVHDLRVALRRCRSVADGVMIVDPDPAWREMKKAGRDLFRSLGSLRDVHVMEEWVQRLGAADDPVAVTLSQHLRNQEDQFKQQASRALISFDRKQWRKWALALPRRIARLRAGSIVFKHLALERWTQAHELHRAALRNRSKTSFHNLRIGLKRFRYIVENFLPEQHAAWSNDLKELQDLLGEVHDLDVLWDTALQVHSFPTIESRSWWHTRIMEERAARIERYRARMLGRNSLWHVWRGELPNEKEIRVAALSRLKLWAAALDPDVKHSVHVAKLSLQLYDSLSDGREQSNSNHSDERSILQVAALLHDVGRSKRERKSHKATYKLIERLPLPLGWTADELRVAAAVSRYNRGAFPQNGQKALQGLMPAQRQRVLRLAGILRLAESLDADHRGTIQRVRVEDKKSFLVVHAGGYSPRTPLAEGIAGARHLLEIVDRRPVLVKAEPVSR
ncbi:MAG: CHAD domain-containing protein [Terriglobales bacterium]